MPQTTLSALDRAALCVGSAALPHVRTRDVPGSALGSALHRVLELRARGIDPHLEGVAMSFDVPDCDRGYFFVTARRCLPVIPPGALAELPLAYHPDGGRVERIAPCDAAHRYAVPSDALAGTLDLVFAEPFPLSPPLSWLGPPTQCPPGSTLVVADYKTGREENVPPIDRNWQLRAGAFMAARWTGAQTVVPAICFIEPPDDPDAVSEGRWEMGKPMGPAELDAFELELRDLLHRIEGAKLDVAAGAVPPLTTGDHCTYCPARSGCPAHLAEVRQLLAPGGFVFAGDYDLTPNEATWIAERLPMIRAAVKKAEEAVKAHVEAHGPLTLASGKVYSTEPVETMHLDPVVATHAMLLHGLPLASILYARGMTEDAIREAVKVDHEAQGIKRKVAPTVRALLAAIDDAGGVTRTVELRYGARHPGKVLEKGDE